MNSDMLSTEKQFEGRAGEFVLTNDWLISIIKDRFDDFAIKVNGQDFDELPLLEFIPSTF